MCSERIQCLIYIPKRFRPYFLVWHESYTVLRILPVYSTYNLPTVMHSSETYTHLIIPENMRHIFRVAAKLTFYFFVPAFVPIIKPYVSKFPTQGCDQPCKNVCFFQLPKFFNSANYFVITSSQN